MYNASVTNGIFKRINTLAYAQAADLMSTKSAADFVWCVKLLGSADFNVGITSRYTGIPPNIFGYDENAVLFSYNNGMPKIIIGSDTIYSNVTVGDVIRFRFRPEQKKLVINLVRAYKS